ncbi:hypothetical protein [[Ruminococcus] torques]|uniref:Uncharacterized protein n=1 Tax=[Ruminococcus] torques ATCC 27756 TaxID=411460 RepID=A5KRK9_9FIRM|nr:hypothetical protein [[Ruminococcus] torques]EDK22936.1 hypothetical protein RUMTOR_02904 [[Ruminococcus] torques ATCC 27756]
MDNRLKFLYYPVTELWGRRQRAQAGNGKTGASEVGVHQAIRCAIRRRDADRKEVEKCVSWLPRKAAIVYRIPVP